MKFFKKKSFEIPWNAMCSFIKDIEKWKDSCSNKRNFKSLSYSLIVSCLSKSAVFSFVEFWAYPQYRLENPELLLWNSRNINNLFTIE